MIMSPRGAFFQAIIIDKAGTVRWPCPPFLRRVAFLVRCAGDTVPPWLGTTCTMALCHDIVPIANYNIDKLIVVLIGTSTAAVVP